MARKTAKKSQRQAFIDKANELGIDVDEAEFDANLQRIARPRPPDSKAKPEKPKKDD